MCPTLHIRLTLHAELGMPCMQVPVCTLLHQKSEVHPCLTPHAGPGPGAAAMQHEAASYKAPVEASLLTIHDHSSLHLM